MNNNSQFTFGDFVWFVGEVTNVNDPQEANRVKVRIKGYHSQDTNEMPDTHLQWAMVMTSPFSASTGGIGLTPHALVKGTQVIGFFLDSHSAQLPMVIGTFPAMNNGVPDVNELARGKSISKQLTSNSQWSEPSSVASPKYPHNKVLHTTSGHSIEIDDTPGKERLHVYHKSGSYVEFHTDGKVIQKMKNDAYLITEQNLYIYAKGNLNLVVDGNVTETIKGNKVSNITGNYIVNCQAYQIKTKASWTAVVGSSAYLKSSGTYTVKSSSIFLN